MAIFELRSAMPVSAAELYAWHVRPGAFERLVPPWQRVDVVERSGPLGEGTRVVLQIKPGFRAYRWEARHTDFIAGRQFRDVQERGPFRRWIHTHRFEPDGDGASFLEDHIEYELPLDVLGRLVAGRGIARDLARVFRFRHRRTFDDLVRHAAQASEPRMRVLISGASGLVGTSLSAFLATGGHRVDRLVRRAPRGGGRNEFGGCDIVWNPDAGTIDAAALEGVDAVVHLSGASIAGGRWTAAYKATIRSSRVNSTRLLCTTLAGLKSPPRVVICASATGYYGNRGDEVVDERSARGAGFLSDVCDEWEAAAEPARAVGVRVVHLRLGVVIAGGGGALAKMRAPFAWGVGGTIGGGRQWLSWIALDDVVYAIHHLMHEANVAGAVNATAPTPITNRELTHALGRVLRRPTVLPLPSFAVRLLFGEMGQACLLEGVRAIPARLSESGYRSAHPDIDSALRTELGRVEL